MSAERMIMVSLGCWASAAIRQQLEALGWKVSACEGALRVCGSGDCQHPRGLDDEIGYPST